MHRHLPALLGFAALVGVAANAEGQGRSPTRPFCWTAHPAPTCRLFLVTNVGGYGTTSGGLDKGGHLVADWGVMVNASRYDALGISYYGSIRQRDLNAEAGWVLRYRRWTGAGSSLEAGIALVESSPFTGGERRIGGMLKFSPAPWVGFAVRNSGRATLLGVDLGALPGLILTLVAVPVLGAVGVANSAS